MCRISFGEGRASQNSDADAARRARRPVAQDFRAIQARPVGELLAGLVFDRMTPDGRVGVERRLGQVERTVRLNFYPKSREFEGVDRPGRVRRLGKDQEPVERRFRGRDARILRRIIDA